MYLRCDRIFSKEYAVGSHSKIGLKASQHLPKLQARVYWLAPFTRQWFEFVVVKLFTAVVHFRNCVVLLIFLLMDHVRL